MTPQATTDSTEIPILPGHYRQTTWYFVRCFLGMIAGIGVFGLGLHWQVVAIQVAGGVIAFTSFLCFFEPICMATMVRLSEAPAKNRLLFANPDNLSRTDGKEAAGKGRDRKNVSVKLSHDESATWPVNKTIEPGFSGYSDLAVANDGTLLLFYERGSTDGANSYKTGLLTVARFNLEWLTDGKDALK